MIRGHVRDFLPRVMLDLPGLEGVLPVEFIVDTGFDGDLALPIALVMRLEVAFLEDRIIRLADGTHLRRPYYEFLLDWNGQERLTEITVLEGQPLLGAILLAEHGVYLEMTDGGEVTVDPL